jgi:hypothetical protein
MTADEARTISLGECTSVLTQAYAHIYEAAAAGDFYINIVVDSVAKSQVPGILEDLEKNGFKAVLSDRTGFTYIAVSWE